MVRNQLVSTITASEVEKQPAPATVLASLVTWVKWCIKGIQGAFEFESDEVRNFVAEVVFDDLKKIP